MKLIKINDLSDVMIENIEYHGREFFNTTNFYLKARARLLFSSLEPTDLTFTYLGNELCISQPYRTSTWFFEECENSCQKNKNRKNEK